MNRFRKPADMLRFAAGRALVRALLIKHGTDHQALHVHATDISFNESCNGSKPSLSAATRELFPAITDFNISHDGDWVVAGITKAGLLGVDVAHIHCPAGMSVDQFIGEFSFQLTEREQEYLLHKSDQRLSDFFRIWTMKEAYAKAVGCGITMDLADIEVIFSTNKGEHVLTGGQACPLRIAAGELGSDSAYIYSHAAAHTSAPPAFNVVTLDTIFGALG
ncbi:hypothetical protein GQ54DRAFT_88451 [Martensiomyces pterosporus]|nr:hypothetical protein GQ54DRAFT_88451 [Martensiomyces pterosporus]